MEARIAQNIMALLERVTVTGKEVPGYIEAVNALRPLAFPAPVETDKEEEENGKAG